MRDSKSLAGGQSTADVFLAAILFRDPRIVGDAIRRGVDVNAGGKNGAIPIVLAAGQGDEPITALLISAGADVNQPDRSKGLTALQAAASGGYAGVVKRLLLAGANADAPFGRSETTALSLAVRRNHWPVAEVLLDFKANPNVYVELPDAPEDQRRISPLIAAVAMNNGPAMVKLIRHGAELNHRKSDGLTALMVASFMGHLDAATILCEAGADIGLSMSDDPNTEPLTALAIARAQGFADIAELLGRKGAK